MIIEDGEYLIVDTETGERSLDFNKMFDLSHYETLPDNMKKVVQNAGFTIDSMGFVRDSEGKDVSYTQIKEMM